MLGIFWWWYGEDSNLYKGLVCFMIVGLKESVPYIIMFSPQTGISADWLKNEVLECLDVLIKNGFNTTAIICDNHNQTFQLPKSYANVQIKTVAVYLCYTGQKKVIFPLMSLILLKTFEIVYLIINDFCFHPLHSNKFKDSIHVTGEELKWKMLHDVFERDAQLDGNLKKAPKLTLKVPHPESNKQNVPLALAIFDETTSVQSSHIFLNTQVLQNSCNCFKRSG